MCSRKILPKPSTIIQYSLFALLIFLSSCKQPTALSAYDLSIVEQLSFDADLLTEIRNYTDSAFEITSGNPFAKWNFNDSMNYLKFQEKKLSGIQVSENEAKVREMVEQLSHVFKEKGYIIYISETHFGYAPDEVTILKTNDQFDLLRFEGTNGINWEIYTEDVIEKLRVWEAEYGLVILAAGLDFVEANYTSIPKDLRKHAEDMYEFCPDIVDQGVGSIEELQLAIASTKQLFLWWD